MSIRSDAPFAPLVLRHEDLLRDAAQQRLLATARRRRRRADRAALRDMWPVVAGVAPFGSVIGVTAANGDVPVLLGVLATPLVYGGSAQLAALTLLGTGAGLLAILAAALVINARLLLYAAALEPRFRHQPAWFRWLAPLSIVDQTFALAAARSDLDDPDRFRRYWLTAGVVLGVGFTAAVAAGAVLGPVLGDSPVLGLAAPACFVGLLMPRLVGRPAVAGAAVAALVAALASAAPNGLGLLLAVTAGLGAALAADRRSP